jgi:tRNA threonylcarbamoyladenosine biosynthesis protein TsaB
MLILGIDTSTEMGSIGLIEGRKLLGEININFYRRHSERLLPNIDYLLQECNRNIEALNGIAVTVGPGSFTGLRIGLSTIRSIIQVLNIPVVGISTLDVLAYRMFAIKNWLVPVIDANRNRVYTSLYRGWDIDILKAKKWKDKVLTLDNLLNKLINLDGEFYFVGNGVEAYQDYLRKEGLNTNFAPVSYNNPGGSVVAELGGYYLNNGRMDSLYNLFPNYLKKPQAEIKWQEKEN